MLDGVLAVNASNSDDDGNVWLVGNKLTYADLAFLTWNNMLKHKDSEWADEWDPSKYPHFVRWWDAMNARPTVQKVFADKAQIKASLSSE